MNLPKIAFGLKLKKFAKIAGEVVLELALTLYYAGKDSDTPTWAKTTVCGVLGEFISPLDAILDFTPIAGYSDDLAVLVVVTAAVIVYVKQAHKDKAKETLKQWFE